MTEIIGVGIGGAVLGAALTTLTVSPTQKMASGAGASVAVAPVGIGVGSLIGLALYGLAIAAGI